MAEYWYCGVRIENIDKVYSYISEEGALPIGSYVLVPFGKQNEERTGEVVSCALYTEENTPFPVEKTKRVITRITLDVPFLNEGFPDEDDTIHNIAEVEHYIGEEDWENVLKWAVKYHNSTNRGLLHKVVECYELCVERNMPIAALNLGTFYYNGTFLKQDFQKAFRLYKIAADAGELRGICNCGYCFYYGRHQEIDYAEAFKYFSLGALLFDDPNCLYKLGDMYWNGMAVEKNDVYAYKLYRRALDRCREWDADDFCLADVQFRVGKCLLYGIGTADNVEQAQELLSQALTNFYKRRKTDPFVSKLIQNTRTLLSEAQTWLYHECI